MEKMEGGLCGNPELVSGSPRSPAMHGGGDENLLHIENEVGNYSCDRCNKSGCLLHPEETDILIDDNVGGLKQVEGTSCSPSDDKEFYLLGGSDDGMAGEERRKVEDYQITAVADNICDDLRGECNNCEALLALEEISILGDCNVGGLERLQGGCAPCDSRVLFSGGSNDGVAEKEGGDLDNYGVGFVAAAQKSKDLVGNKFCNDVYSEPDKCKSSLASEENNILVYDNRSFLEQVDGVCCSPCVDKGISFLCGSDDELADKESGIAEEYYMGFISAKQESDHNEQQIFVNGPDMVILENDSFAHMDPEITNCIEANCSLSCENVYGSVDAVDDTVTLVEYNKEVENQNCNADAPGEVRKHPGLKREQSFHAPNSIYEQEHIGLSSDLENAHHICTDGGVQEVVARAFSSHCGSAIISHSGDHFTILSSERLEMEGDGGSSSMPVREKGHFIIQGKSSAEVPATIDEQKRDESRSLSLSRASLVSSKNPSRTNNQLEGKYVSGLFEDKICDTCDNLILSSDMKFTEDHLSSSKGQGQQLQCLQGETSQVKADISSYTRGMDVKAPTVFDGDGCHNSHLLNSFNNSKPTSGEEAVSLSALERSSTSISLGPGLLMTTCEQRSNSDSINISSSCTHIDTLEGGDGETKVAHKKPCPLLVFRRTNPKRVASSMNSQTDVRSDQLSRTRNVVRISTKGVDAKSNLSIKFNISSKVSRKRSNTHRVARHSVWGDAANLVSIFKQTGKLSNCDSYSIQSQIGKLRKRSARTSKLICSVSANLLHPKDQIYQKPVSSDFVDTQHASLPNLDANSNLGIYNGVLDTVNKLSEDRFASDIKILQHRDKDLESTLTQDTSNDNVLGEFPGVSSHTEGKTLVEAVEKRHMLYPGSSPDSDVFNPIMDVGVISCEAVTERIDDAEANPSTLVPEIALAKDHNATDLRFSTSSLQAASYLDISPHQRRNEGQKEKKNSKASQNEHSIAEHSFCKDNLHDSGTPHNNTVKKIKACVESIGGSTNNVLRLKISSNESAKNGQHELENHQESRTLNCELEEQTACEKDEMEPFEDKPVSPVESKGTKLSRSKKRGVSKDKSSSAISSRYARKGPHQQRKKTSGKSHKRQNAKISAPNINGEELSSRIASETSLAGSSEQCHPQTTIDMSCGVERSLHSERAWVQCDNCHKWRAISTELADFINETNITWICKDNSAREFASCLIPQEMSNEEINAELGISDASCDEDTSLSLKNIGASATSKPAAQPASWTSIRSNLYLHRSRRSQTIDEIMVCHCKPPTDGSLGCGDSCLNRLLSIECVKGTCPCGDLCSNQQFQKRKYAKLKWVRCGKKGFGLQLLEDVSCGQFLIEYVGEVLDWATYEARQRYYASKGQKHFYFMTLNGGEVIDAHAKGNLGRFINHSCSPNCQTEKWMVNGEVCIGLFTLRDMKKGEEVTFDYNYEKVVGAAAKKCLCGSSSCRGYIGGGEDSEVVVQEDSDSEDPEPLMIHEDSEIELDPECVVSDANHSWPVKDNDISQETLVTRCSPATPLLEDSEQSKDICRPESVNPLSSLGNMELTESEEPKLMSGIQVPGSSPESLDCAEFRGTRPLSDVKLPDLPVSVASLKNTMPDSMVKDFNIHQTSITKQGKLKNSLAESSNSDGQKRRRKTSKIVIPQKYKKAPLYAHNDHLSGVEKELSNLLDLNGGISKQKGSTRGYLKLLFVTAAEGDDVGGSSKSIRDLSLILDALLKTTSRTVLVDIINKNGLQMLHNIMKQNRSKFNRIPIIRKLLKVLEFLVMKEILTPEHMSKDPPRSGVESFRESMLALTRHNDIQVHQIARNFRDKWLPRNIRSLKPLDRDDYQSNFQRSNCSWFQSSIFGWPLDQGTRGSDAIICVSPMVNQPDLMIFDAPGQIDLPRKQSVNSSSPLTGNNAETRFRTGKRRSRWDQLADISGDPPSQDTDSDMSFKLRKTINPESKKTKLDVSACIEDSVQQNIDNEAPPGFESLQKDHCAAAPENMNLEDNVAVGYLQERYLSQSSISYGMPLTFVQQPGNIEVADKLRYQEQAVARSMPLHPIPHLPPFQEWPVAPSMPFHPFPPLPPYPRVNSMISVQNQESSDMIRIKTITNQN